MLWALLMIAPPAEGGLAWDAPAECPTGQDVESRIARLLAVEGPPRLAASGSIVAHAGGYALTVSVADETRVVTASTCEPLGSVAALVIAVAHDPIGVATTIDVVAVDRVAPHAEVEPPPQPAATPTVVDAPGDRVPSSRPDRTQARRRGSKTIVRAGVMPFVAVGGGALPGAGVGFGLGVAAFGRRFWRVELAGSGFVPRRAQARDAPEFGADLWLVGGSLRGCGVPRAATVEFPLCLGAELDAWGARGRGPALSGPTQQVQVYAAALASAGVSVQLRPWIGLAARAELLVSARRPAVHIDGVGFVFRAHPVDARLVLGPELRFP